MADKTVTYRLSADISQFKAQVAQAGQSLKKFADEATAAPQKAAAGMSAAQRKAIAEQNRRQQEFLRGVEQLGGTAGRIGLVAAAGLGAAVMAAANFDQAMSNVQAATHESAANMDLLREAALEAGERTAFSATEAAAGIENLAKAGVSTADILNGGLNGALDLAAAGSLDVAAAAEIAATAMTQFGLSGDDVDHVADLLAAAAGKAQGEVSDMGMALKQSGLVAAQMGVSIEEATGTLAAFASAGLLGSDAGTSFRTMLLRLANPSKEAADTMAQLGINAYDAQGNLVSMSNLAGQLETAFAGQSQATRDAALATIFGSDAIRAANVLYTQGADGIADWTAKVDDSGYAAETAATRLDNLKGDLEALGGALETALIGTGEGSQGVLRGLTQGLTDVVNAYNKLPDAAQSATAATLGLTAVIGGGVWVGSRMLIGISETRQALADLGEAAPKAGRALRTLGTASLVVGGIVALDEAVDGLLKTMREAPPGVEKMTGAIIDVARSGDLDALGSGFRDLGEVLDEAGRSGNKFAQDWLGWVPNFTGLLPGENAIERFDRIREQVEVLDQAMASLVSTGEKQTATDFLDNLGLDEAQMKTLLSLMPQYEEALEGVANESRLAGEGAEAGAAGIGELGDAADGATTEVDGFKAALDRLNGILDQRASFRDYEAALDDFTASLKENGRSFDITTEKGRANQAALDDIAASALQVAETMEGTARTRFLQAAMGDIRQLAKDMDLPKSEARRLIRLLQEADATSVEPTVDANTDPAERRLELTRAELDALDKVRSAPTADLRDLASRALANIRAQLRALDGDTAKVTVVHTTEYRRTSVGGGGAYGRELTGSADGNLFEFAAGGVHMPRIGDQWPQIRPYSGPRGLTWSEEGSGPWEAFISGHPAKADRSRSIAAEVVARLGGQAFFADGGMTAAPQVNVTAKAGPVSVALSDRDVQRIAAAVRQGAAEGTSAREHTGRQALTAAMAGGGGPW